MTSNRCVLISTRNTYMYAQSVLYKVLKYESLVNIEQAITCIFQKLLALVAHLSLEQSTYMRVWANLLKRLGFCASRGGRALTKGLNFDLIRIFNKFNEISRRHMCWSRQKLQAKCKRIWFILKFWLIITPCPMAKIQFIRKFWSTIAPCLAA